MDVGKYVPTKESGHDQLNYYLGFRKYATYVLNWPICQLRPIVIQEISAENTVGLCLEAGVVNKYGVKQSPPQQQKENEKRWRM